MDIEESKTLSDAEIEALVLKHREATYKGESVRVELSDTLINDLATRAKEGNELAKELVLTWGNRLVAPHPAHIQWIKYASVSPEDMWQEGRIALMTAISKYDAERGHDFGAYASRIVSNTLGEWAERNSLTISVPRHARRRLRREGVVDETTRLAQAAELLPRYLSSLMTPGEENRGDGLISTLPDQTDNNNPELELERKERVLAVRDAFSRLDELEKQILYYRYIVGLTQEKTHKLLKIGMSTLRALEEEALVHLNEELEEYLYDDRYNTVS